MDEELAKLIAVVKELSDYEEASSALLEIKRRASKIAADLALDILVPGRGDVYLQAFAFSIFYDVDMTGAFDYMRRNAVVCEAYVFGSMLSNVSDDVGIVDEIPELIEMVNILEEAKRSRNPDELKVVAKSVEEFERIYHAILIGPYGR